MMSEEEPRNGIEPGGRARRRASPGTRTKAAAVRVPGTRVPVVYYLCRNRQLDHPHLMEVTLASPQGLYLRDVISRLDALRGKGMAAMYSWSCKWGYKNGFVWHDLSEGDLLRPAQGSEYVLKGSELLHQSRPPPPPDHHQNTSAKVQLPKPTPTQQDESPRFRGSPPPPAAAAAAAASVSVIKAEAPQPALASSPSSSTIGDDEHCRTPQIGSAGSSSPKTTRGSMSSSGSTSPSLTAYKVRGPVAARDAGTQTDGKGKELCTSTCTDNEAKLVQQGQDSALSSQQASPPTERKVSEIVEEDDDPPAGAAGACWSGRDRSGTLESLIREEAGMRGGARILEEEEEDDQSLGAKLKPRKLLTRLITCGSCIMSVKNHPGYGLVQTYKPQFTHFEFPSSPALSPLGALLRHPDHLPASPATTCDVRVSETEHSGGSLLLELDTAGSGKLRRRTSSNNQQDGVSEGGGGGGVSEADSVRLGCRPDQAIKMAEQPTGGAFVSVTTDFSGEPPARGSSGQNLSTRTSKRLGDPWSGKILLQSSRVGSMMRRRKKACFWSSGYHPMQ